MKKFFEIIKNLIECKIESMEGINFRIYFIEYLKYLIYEYLQFFSEKEKKEFLILLGQHIRVLILIEIIITTIIIMEIIISIMMSRV